MRQDNQYREDKERLASLIKRHTGISKERLRSFLSEYNTGQMLSCADMLCETSTQRDKLTALFEFKRLYETVKQSELRNEYRLDSVANALDYFRNYFADIADKEHVAMAYLNTQKHIITTKIVGSGTLNHAPINSREIIKEALFCNADSVILAHNHPSGVADVSQYDIDVTTKLRVGIAAAGVTLLDHIVVAGDKSVSLLELGHIKSMTTQQEYEKTAQSLQESHKAYTKPQRIKEQLASAEKQVALESKSSVPQRKHHNRDSR